MNKEALKAKLDEVKAKIKSNSKDTHFAESLINDLLSLKGQLCVVPTVIRIDENDILDKFSGNTFEMFTTKKGEAVYHVKGGYTLIADHRMVSLNNAIAGYIYAAKTMDTLNESEQEALTLDMSAAAYVMNLPFFAFSDQDFLYKIAEEVIQWLREKYDKAMEEPLHPETPEEDTAYREAAMWVESLKNEHRE